MRSFNFLLFLVLASTLNCGEPSGVLLQYGDSGESLLYDEVTSGGINYYGWRRGPYIENRYAAYRFMMQSEYAGSFDPYSKSAYVPIIGNFSDNQFNKNKPSDFGRDVYHVGDKWGLAGLLFKAGPDWVRIPKADQTERIVVEVIDPSLESPHLKIHYKNWKLSPDQVIDVVLSIETSWDDRFLHCEILVNNFDGEIGVGMTGFGDKETVSLDEDLGLLYGFGAYATGGDQMLQVVHVGPYFKAATQVEGKGTILIVEPSPDGLFEMNLMASWGKEPSPFFKADNWQDLLKRELSALTDQSQTRR